eukprot:Awhi_evm1s3441
MAPVPDTLVLKTAELPTTPFYTRVFVGTTAGIMSDAVAVDTCVEVARYFRGPGEWLATKDLVKAISDERFDFVNELFTRGLLYRTRLLPPQSIAYSYGRVTSCPNDMALTAIIGSGVR